MHNQNQKYFYIGRQENEYILYLNTSSSNGDDTCIIPLTKNTDYWDWENLFNDHIETDIYALQEDTKAKYNTKMKDYIGPYTKDLEECLSDTAVYIVNINANFDSIYYNTFIDEDSHISITKISDTDSFEEIMNVMDKYDPEGEIKISSLSCVDFSLSLLIPANRLTRNIHSARDLLPTFIEISNLSSIARVPYYLDIQRSLFLFLFNAILNGINDIDALIVHFLDYLKNSGSQGSQLSYLYHRAEIIWEFKKRAKGKKNQYKLFKAILDYHAENKLKLDTSKFFTSRELDLFPELFYNYFISAKLYTRTVVRFLIRNQDYVKISEIDADKIKQVSLKDYYDLIGEKIDEEVINLAGRINGDRDVRIYSLTSSLSYLVTFANEKNLDELKEMNLDPIYDALLNRLKAKHAIVLSETRASYYNNIEEITNIQYICDQTINHLLKSNLAIHSRVKLIEKNKDRKLWSGVTRENNFCKVFHNSLAKSTDERIIKHLVNYNL